MITFHFSLPNNRKFKTVPYLLIRCIYCIRKMIIVLVLYLICLITNDTLPNMANVFIPHILHMLSNVPSRAAKT